MGQRFVGPLIGATFGMIFVLLNAHEPLPPLIGTTLRVVAVLALLSLVVTWVLTAREPRPADAGPPDPGAGNRGFGSKYWLVVAGEVGLLVAGLAARRSLGFPEEANVAWIALVVGLHFFPLARIWRARSIQVPAVILTVLGAAGLLLTATPAVAWVPFVSGVLSGITLLTCTVVVATGERHAAGARS